MLNWNVVLSVYLGLQSIDCLTAQYAYSSLPLFQKTYIRIQKEVETQILKQNLDARTVLRLFASHPPETPEGWIQYGALLHTRGTINAKIKECVRQFWIQNVLSSDQTRSFLKVWSKILGRSDNEKKIIFLLTTNTPQNPLLTHAQDVLKMCAKHFPATHELHIAVGLLQLDPSWEPRLLQKKIHRYFSPLLRRSYLRFLMRTDRLEEAFRYWTQWKQDIANDHYTFHKELGQAKFYILRTLARDLLQLGNTFEAKHQKHLSHLWYHRAAQIMEYITPKQGECPIENSWLAGFVQMHLHHWKHAANHFSTMMQQAFSKQEYVVASLSRERYHAKASFWAGICAQKLMQLHNAKKYFETASKYPFLFYGQMALTRLKRPLVMRFTAQSALQESRVIKTLVSLLDQSNVRRNVGQNALMNALLDDLIDHFSSSQECWAFLDLLRQRFPSEAVYLARRLSAHRTRYVFPLAYPTCPLPRPFKDPALVWSIALGETCFCPSVVSSKGALGVMQIMPEEVPQYAKKAGLRSDLKRMKEFNYGMSLGIEELKEKLTRYQQKYILGIASYNAGSKKLEEWRSSLYPCEEKDALLRSCIWIERIPYEETRNYICKIVSFYNVYRWMQGNALNTADVEKLLEL